MLGPRENDLRAAAALRYALAIPIGNRIGNTYWQYLLAIPIDNTLVGRGRGAANWDTHCQYQLAIVLAIVLAIPIGNTPPLAFTLLCSVRCATRGRGRLADDLIPAEGNGAREAILPGRNRETNVLPRGIVTGAQEVLVLL